MLRNQNNEINYREVSNRPMSMVFNNLQNIIAVSNQSCEVMIVNMHLQVNVKLR